MHLHPKWQRTILSDLIKAFQKFNLLLTHSPFIIQNLRADELINLHESF